MLLPVFWLMVSLLLPSPQTVADAAGVDCPRGCIVGPGIVYQIQRED